MKYKEIIKQTHGERPLVDFISKAVPTLENYSFATKMHRNSYKPGELICKEGQMPSNIMVIMEGECEIIKMNSKSETFRGESGIGLISESLINNKIITVSSLHWIAEETTFYNRPLNYSVRAKSIVRLLICPGTKIISEIPKEIRDSLK